MPGTSLLVAGENRIEATRTKVDLSTTVGVKPIRARLYVEGGADDKGTKEDDEGKDAGGEEKAEAAEEEKTEEKEDDATTTTLQVEPPAVDLRLDCRSPKVTFAEDV